MAPSNGTSNNSNGRCNDNCSSPSPAIGGAAAVLTPSPAAATTNPVAPTDTPSSPSKRRRMDGIKNAVDVAHEAVGEDKMLMCIAKWLAEKGYNTTITENNNGSGNNVLGDVAGQVENTPPAKVNKSAVAQISNLEAALAAENAIDPKAFYCKLTNKNTGETEPRKRDAAKQAKKRAIDELYNAANNHWKKTKITPEQQNLAIVGLLTRRGVEIAGPELQSQRAKEDEIDIVGNLKEAIALGMEKCYTNDGKHLLKTIEWAIAPSDDTKVTPGGIRNTSQKLGYKTQTLKKRMKAAVSARKNIMEAARKNGVRKVKLAIDHKRKSRTTFTPELIGRLHDWLENHNGLITFSPKPSDTVTVIDPITNRPVKKQKMHYHGSVRELHNLMKSPVEEGGFAEARDADGKVQMSDTTLRALLPSNLSRMTDSHMQLCGCKICIIAKNFIHVLNKWCTWTYKSMLKDAEKPQNADGKEEMIKEADLFRSWSHNEDGTPKRTHPRDAVDMMTCAKVDVGHGRKLPKLSCCRGGCKCCPCLHFPKQLRDKGEDARLTSFEYYPWRMMALMSPPWSRSAGTNHNSHRVECRLARHLFKQERAILT